MKVFLMFVLSLLIVFPINASDLDDLQKTVYMMSKQNSYFSRVLNDIEEWRNAPGDSLLMVEELTQNIAEACESGDTDPKLARVAWRLLSNLKASGTGPVQGLESAPRSPARKRKIPAFFVKVTEAVKEIKEKLYDEFMDYDFSLGLKLFKFNIIEGIKISALYKYKLDSDYRKGIHTRVDEWTLKNNIELGTILKNTLSKSVPVYVNITPQKQVIFARHFKTKKEAFKALPMTPVSLPLSHEKALKLKTGDFVSIPTSMGFTAGLSFGLTQGVFDVGASGGILVTGNFRVNIYKVDADHVRLKISGMRSRGTNGKINVGYGLKIFGYDPTGHINLDDQAVNILGSNVFTISASKIRASQLTVDYTFDLRSPEACEAYDAIVKNAFLFKPVEIGLSFLKKHGLENVAFGDLDCAEELYLADRNLPEEKRRVDRNFMGSIYSETSERQIRIGMRLLGYENDQSDVENRVQKISDQDHVDHYIYPVFTKNSEFSILFGFWKEKTTDMALSFQQSTPSWQPEKFYNMIFIHNFYDKRCRESEMADFMKDTRNLIGESLCNQIGMNEYQDIKKTESFRAKIKVALGESNIKAVLDSVDDEELMHRAVQPLMEDFTFTDPNPVAERGNDSNIVISRDWGQEKSRAAALCNRWWGGQFHWNRLQELLMNLKECKGMNLFDSEKRIRELFSESKFNRKILPRLLIELVHQKGDTEHLYASVYFGGKHIKTFEKTHGSNPFEGILHDINELIYQIRYNSDAIPE